MTIEFRPPTLASVASCAYAEKRLKNRTGFMKCETCNQQANGFILEMIREAKSHDSDSPDHRIIVSEDACRQGLIQTQN